MLELKNQKILIIAPHPDDEIVGCGGLIAKAKGQGGMVFVHFLTNGNTKDYSKTGKSTAKERSREIEKVAEFLKYDNYYISFEGNSHHLKLDQIPQIDLINAIESRSPISMEKIRPTIVIFPSSDSYSQDHKAAAYATFAACRPASGRLKFQSRMVLSYEIPADQWNLKALPPPNFFIKLSPGHLKKKIAALKLYRSQLREHPNPRSINTLKSLANIRGAQSGSNLAEAFLCHRFLS